MINTYKKFWKNIFNFSGVASLGEYWIPVIINVILGVILTAILQMILGHSIEDIYTWGDWSAKTGSLIISFIVWLATLSLSFRRLHDTSRSGWWILVNIIPFIGQLWFIILMLWPSRSNNYQ